MLEYFSDLEDSDSCPRPSAGPVRNSDSETTFTEISDDVPPPKDSVHRILPKINRSPLDYPRYQYLSDKINTYKLPPRTTSVKNYPIEIVPNLDKPLPKVSNLEKLMGLEDIISSDTEAASINSTVRNLFRVCSDFEISKNETQSETDDNFDAIKNQNSMFHLPSFIQNEPSRHRISTLNSQRKLDQQNIKILKSIIAEAKYRVQQNRVLPDTRDLDVENIDSKLSSVADQLYENIYNATHINDQRNTLLKFIGKFQTCLPPLISHDVQTYESQLLKRFYSLKQSSATKTIIYKMIREECSKLLSYIETSDDTNWLYECILLNLSESMTSKDFVSTYLTCKAISKIHNAEDMKFAESLKVVYDVKAIYKCCKAKATYLYQKVEELKKSIQPRLVSLLLQKLDFNHKEHQMGPVCDINEEFLNFYQTSFSDLDWLGKLAFTSIDITDGHLDKRRTLGGEVISSSSSSDEEEEETGLVQGFFKKIFSRRKNSSESSSSNASDSDITEISKSVAGKKINEKESSEEDDSSEEDAEPKTGFIKKLFSRRKNSSESSEASNVDDSNITESKSVTVKTIEDEKSSAEEDLSEESAKPKIGFIKKLFSPRKDRPKTPSLETSMESIHSDTNVTEQSEPVAERKIDENHSSAEEDSSEESAKPKKGFFKKLFSRRKDPSVISTSEASIKSDSNFADPSSIQLSTITKNTSHSESYGNVYYKGSGKIKISCLRKC